MVADKLSKIFKALSNPNRLELYLKISKESNLTVEGHHCLLSKITCKLNIRAPTISHHIKELENAGLISTEREGKFLMAKINKEMFDVVHKVFQEIK